MIQVKKHTDTKFCDDNQLSYKECQTEFVDGQGLVFDDAYRLAHLPLVAPDHPLVISSKPGSSYKRGVHELIYSIAIPIVADELLSSAAFKKLCNEIALSKFSHKLSWDIFNRRKSKLHATVCSAVSTGSAPDLDERMCEELRAIGPISVCIRGLFSGNINVGRLYLKVYPELRDGTNVCHQIQNIFQSPITDLYVVGLFNFAEELNLEETQELREILEFWKNVDFLVSRIENLWLLKSRDDLVLNGSVEKLIPIH